MSGEDHRWAKASELQQESMHLIFKDQRMLAESLKDQIRFLRMWTKLDDYKRLPNFVELKTQTIGRNTIDINKFMCN